MENCCVLKGYHGSWFGRRLRETAGTEQYAEREDPFCASGVQAADAPSGKSEAASERCNSPDHEWQLHHHRSRPVPPLPDAERPFQQGARAQLASRQQTPGDRGAGRVSTLLGLRHGAEEGADPAGRPLHSSQNAEIQQGSSIVSIFKGHKEYISDLSFVGNSQILTSSGDKSIFLWDMEKGTKAVTFNGHLGDVLGLSVCPTNSNLFASCSSDRLSNLWDIRCPLDRRQFQISLTHDSSAVKFFPDGYSFACGTDDGELKLFDIRSDCELANYPVKMVHQHVRPHKTEEISISDSASSLRLSHKSSMVAALDNPGVLSIDFSRSGRLLFVSYAEYSSIVVWDSVMGTVVGTMDGHRDAVSAVRVSPDGLGIATASRDHTSRVWTV
ncbi:hypothetical protein KL914_004905 [Ogataea haglerorum]|nr:hypothetical protein KL914_004905 [Ogataea haglerorum]